MGDFDWLVKILPQGAAVSAVVGVVSLILLKYQPVAGLGELGAVLLRMSQGLGRLKTLLADPHHVFLGLCSFKQLWFSVEIPAFVSWRSCATDVVAIASVKTLPSTNGPRPTR